MITAQEARELADNAKSALKDVLPKLSEAIAFAAERGESELDCCEEGTHYFVDSYRHNHIHHNAQNELIELLHGFGYKARIVREPLPRQTTGNSQDHCFVRINW